MANLRARYGPLFQCGSLLFCRRASGQTQCSGGLVTSDVGGTPIQSWISLESLRGLPAYARTTTRVHRNGHAALFNGMIAPLTPLTIRGVLWYQGESNAGVSAADYALLLKTLIADWRGRFHCKNLPFGVVQLANYGGLSHESGAAPVREAQTAVASEVPDVGLAVAIDLGDGCIHPPNKRDVGRRLALWAGPMSTAKRTSSSNHPSTDLARSRMGRSESALIPGDRRSWWARAVAWTSSRKCRKRSSSGLRSPGQMAGSPQRMRRLTVTAYWCHLLKSRRRYQCATPGPTIRRAVISITGRDCRLLLFGWTVSMRETRGRP